jgi:hypothetical protein
MLDLVIIFYGLVNVTVSRHFTIVITTKQGVTMSKSTNFSGQPILNQQKMFLDNGKIRKISHCFLVKRD